MRKIFRCESIPSLRITNIVEYTLEFLKKHPGTSIFVGTDSQSHKRRTQYATVIAYHIGTIDIDGEFYGRGVHVIYYKEKVSRIKNTWDRLWKECEMSVEVAEYLRKNGILINRIDLDYNDDEQFESSRLISAGRGYVMGLGYNCATKPADLLATRAADHLCR